MLVRLTKADLKDPAQLWSWNTELISVEIQGILIEHDEDLKEIRVLIPDAIDPRNPDKRECIYSALITP